MRQYLLAIAIITASFSSAALADDPRDPAMQNSDARQRDAEMVRKLNRQEAERVRERDASYGKRMTGSKDYDKARAEYERDQARYEKDMAEWRRATGACRGKNKSACR